MNPNQKYGFNRSTLNSIDTEEKAYFLGWIATDGYLQPTTKNKPGHSVRLELKETDASIIPYLFSAVFGDDSPPLVFRQRKQKDGKTFPQAGINLCSQEVVSDIRHHLNLSPSAKKTFAVRMPSLSTDNLMWAFLRAVFEGDGHVSSLAAKESVKTPSGGSLQLRIVSASPKFLKDMKRFLSNQGIQSSIVSHGTQTQTLRIYTTNAVAFLRKIYPETIAINQRLERKYVISREWLLRADRIAELARTKFAGDMNQAARFFNKTHKSNLLTTYDLLASGDCNE